MSRRVNDNVEFKSLVEHCSRVKSRSQRRVSLKSSHVTCSEGTRTSHAVGERNAAKYVLVHVYRSATPLIIARPRTSCVFHSFHDYDRHQATPEVIFRPFIAHERGEPAHAHRRVDK